MSRPSAVAARLEHLESEDVSVVSISPNTYNPNRQSRRDFHLLVLSIHEDGFTQPVLVNRKSKQLIDGEHRWMAWIVYNQLKKRWSREKDKIRIIDEEEVNDLRSKYLEIIDAKLTIPVVFTDMTEQQMRVSTLRHNRARGSEDFELTRTLLRDLRQLGALDWARDSLQLDEIELQRIINDESAAVGLASEEYGEAWVPDAIGDFGSTERSDYKAAKHDFQSFAATKEAIKLAAQREKRVSETTDPQEIRKINKEFRVYTVKLMFSGEESTVVRDVLGETPAERLLEFCERRLPDDWVNPKSNSQADQKEAAEG